MTMNKRVRLFNIYFRVAFIAVSMVSENLGHRYYHSRKTIKS